MEYKLKTVAMVVMIMCAAVFTGCEKETTSDMPEQTREVMYQVSLLQGLTYGDYHGSITVKELKQYGDTGIGTFDKLNGELIMLDGEVYRAAGDGSVEVVSDDETIPFSNVTFIDADKSKDFKNISNYDALCS